MNCEPVTTVSALTEQIKEVMETRFFSVRIEGEIGQINVHRSGHVYCSLKDDGARIEAVIWRSTVLRLAYKPAPGEQVVVSGRISVYAPHGSYKLVISSIEPAGLGKLHALLEQTRIRLQEKGLFDEVHKKALPVLPRCVGVVTSSTGAARRDIESVIHRRSPQIPIMLYPANVQGPNAVDEIISGIRRLDRENTVDVIIVGRGGGSLEDLWSFNDERLAMAIFNCETPIISAVGHETDTTISDLIADRRAPTPSAAAEIAVPIRDDLLLGLVGLSERLDRQLARRLKLAAETLSTQVILLRRGVETERLKLGLGQLVQRVGQNIERRIADGRSNLNRQELVLTKLNPVNQLTDQKEQLASLGHILERRLQQKLSRAQLLFQRTIEKLNALSPLGVLARGYSLTTHRGRVVMSANDLKVSDEIEVRVNHGLIHASVLSIEENH